MTHAFRYVGLALAIFILLFTTLIADGPVDSVPSEVATSQGEVATSTPPIPFALSATTTVATASTSTPPKKSPPKATKPSPQPAAPAPVATSAASEAPSTQSAIGSLDLTASALRGALVNIVCYAPAGSRIRSISGTGVIIDPKGIILTNAHVAQSFLLAKEGVGCSIRTGGPAKTAYKASLLFISPAWVTAHASLLTQASATGTGEFDFALLGITQSATDTPLPSSFSFVPLAVSAPAVGTPVVIASYGAQFLAATQIQTALFPTIVFGSVKDVFTFGTNTVDILALGGSAAAQEGSSGGGVADMNGLLVGTITTSTIEGDTSTRSLNAISATYVRSDYATEAGQSLSTLLAQPISLSVAQFAPQAQALTHILTAQL